MTNPLWVQGTQIETETQSTKPLWIKASALNLCEVLRIYADKYPGQVIKLPYNNVIVKYIVDYLNHHDSVTPPEIAIPLRSNVMHEVCSDFFDAKFINQVGENRANLYELCNAADSTGLNIDSLWSLCCAKIASLIKGKPNTQLQELLSS